MSADPQIQDVDRSGPKPFQFTIRSLLAVTALTAIFLSCLFGGPDWLAGFAVYLVALSGPVTLITILVYGHGYQRTFCIGALTFVGALTLFLYGDTYPLFFLLEGLEGEEGFALRCYALVGLHAGALIASFFGILAIFVRQLVEGAPSTSENRPGEPSPDDPQGPFA